MRVIILLCFLMGCGEYGITPYKFNVDPRLEPYVESFYQEAASRGRHPHRNVRVIIGDTGGEYRLGVAKFRGRHITVVIADWHWQNMIRDHSGDTLFYAMENLVFHEMGHAVLDLDHCDPCNSIMGTYNSVFMYVGDPELRNYLLNELFE